MTSLQPIPQNEALNTRIMLVKAAFEEMSQILFPEGEVPNRISIWEKRTLNMLVEHFKNNFEIPKDLLKSYSSEAVKYERPLPKYCYRPYNTLREFSRCVVFLPELLQMDHRCSLLDLSTGSGGMIEVAEAHGHYAIGADLLGRLNPAYKEIYRVIDIDVVPFDGRITPFPYSSESFDYVTCFQAIENYGKPKTYLSSINEMRRIARKKVVIIFNEGGGTYGRVPLFIKRYLKTNPKAVLGQCPDTKLSALSIPVENGNAD